MTLRLEGKVVGPWADELDRAWHALVPSLGSRRLAVDLRGITFMDRAGQRVLADIYRGQRAEFLANTPLTKYFAEEARSSVNNHEQEESDHAGPIRSRTH